MLLLHVSVKFKFKIVGLASGTERVLAGVEETSGPKVGRYRVNVQNINAIVGVFKKSAREADVVLVDEIDGWSCRRGRLQRWSSASLRLTSRSSRLVVFFLHKARILAFTRNGGVRLQRAHRACAGRYRASLSGAPQAGNPAPCKCNYCRCAARWRWRSICSPRLRLPARRA